MRLITLRQAQPSRAINAQTNTARKEPPNAPPNVLCNNHATHPGTGGGWTGDGDGDGGVGDGGGAGGDGGDGVSSREVKLAMRE